MTAEDSSSVNYTVTVTDLAWTERTSAGNRNWYSLASSVDGTKLTGCRPCGGISATTNIGYLYTSTDSGATWTERTSAGNDNWYSVASSADGTKLAAIVWSESRVTGTSIFQRTAEPPGLPRAVLDRHRQRVTAGRHSVISGRYETCGQLPGMSISTPQLTGERTQTVPRLKTIVSVLVCPIASSGDGTKTAALSILSNYIYTSSDSGVNWTERTSAGSKNWMSIAISSDGSRIVAGLQENGYIYTSTDDGVN